MAKSLSDAPNFVPNAFVLAPKVAFKPENTLLGTYTFLPWVRTGVGAAIAAAPVAPAIRARVAVVVPVQAEGVADLPAEQALQVRGPGDVLGIDERQIIRRYPQPGAPNAEDTFLAHVELDRPDLPWLFSPAAPAGERLNPWLVLVAVRASVSSIAPGHEGRPPRLSTLLGELQPLQDSWAWAHAQLIPVDGASLEDRLTSQYAPVNLSRLICPRQLDPDLGWIACVVPAYDAGVKAGLGAAQPGTLGPAWTRGPGDDDTAIELPVYASWRFQTAKDGDFESLAKKLDGVPAPWQIGRRVMDAAKPAGGLPELGAADQGRLQTVRGPLVSPQLPPSGSADPDEAAAAIAETAGWPTGETEGLRTLLNRPDELAGKDGELTEAERPLIGPEIYGRYHAARSRVEASHDADWFGQLNLRPPHRVVGGLGTRVIQMDQEKLMQSAWAQVGDVDAANRQLRRAQLGRFVGTAFFTRHVSTLAYGDALGVTRRAHSRMLAQGGLTVAASLADSHVADAAATPAFRRLTRPLGLLARHAAGRRDELDRLVVEGGLPRDFQRPYADLDGVASVSMAAAEALDPKVVGEALGVDPGDAVQALLDHGATLAETAALPDALTLDAIHHAAPDPSFDVSEIAGDELLELLKQSLPDPAREPVRAISYVELLSALAVAGGPAGGRARELAQQLSERLGAREIEANGRLVELLGAAREVSPDDALGALRPIADDLVAKDWPGTPILPPFEIPAPTLIGLLDPAVTVTARIKARIGTLPPWLPPDWFDDLLVQPIMAAPVFHRPMYEALDDYSRNWLIPNLAVLPQPDLVTVLETNAAFVEAFLAGLSHEMGRELLWRGYPTDQRGTYFRRFWNRAKDELEQDLHRFTDTPLDSHLEPELKGRLVLLVRGELIRRYPDAIVLALRAGSREPPPTPHPVFIDPTTDASAMAPSLFHAHLEPDVVLAGFDLTAAQVKAQDWWFVIAEHPTGPRFGLDEPPHRGSFTKDNLAWGDLAMRFGRFLDATVTKAVPDFDDADPPAFATPPSPVFTFGADAASVAHILLQNPVRAAWDAKKLLGPTGAVS